MRIATACLVGLACAGWSAKGLADTQADWQAAASAAGNFTVESFVRRDLGLSLAEYSAVVRVGPGTYDKIGVHRVVKESSPGHPIVAPKALVMAHGDISTFDSGFMPSTSVAVGLMPVSQSLGVYLAQKDIDLWGWDRRATFVPNTEINFAFMSQWGSQLSA
jgi:hypothetical protein